MFTPNEKAVFPELSSLGNFTLPKLLNIIEKNSSKLEDLISKELQGKNYGSALAYAQQLAIYHGIKGLEIYLTVKIQQLESASQQGDEIKSEAFNTYVYLILTRKLAENDNNHQIKNNINSLETTLKALTNLSALEPEAHNAADKLLAKITNKDKTNTNSYPTR